MPRALQPRHLDIVFVPLTAAAMQDRRGHPMESTQVQQAFMDAWNAHDLARIMEMVTDDCDFITADRRRFTGTAELEAFFPTVWQRLPDAHWNVIGHHRIGDRGFSEWIFTGTDSAGNRIETRGVDLLTFRGDQICRKDAFRKTTPPT
jgi:taurine dehydrogenase small subunit